MSVDSIHRRAALRIINAPDEVLSAVANDCRQHVLRTLTSTINKTMEFDELVDHVADRIQSENSERSSDEHRQYIRTELHHIHLPMLEDSQLIDYDENVGRVRLVDNERTQEILTLVTAFGVHTESRGNAQ